MSKAELPYYGEIDVNGMPFCVGCKETELQIDVSQLFGDATCIEKTIVIQCQHLKKCAHLLKTKKEAETWKSREKS